MEVLTKKQMQYLKDLGLDTSDCSAYLHNYGTIMEPEYEVCSTPDIGDIDTFTLYDTIGLLPLGTLIEKVKEDSYKASFGQFSTTDKSPLQALYQLLVWLLENDLL